MLQNEITACLAAFELVNLGDTDGYKTLQYFGINSEDFAAIKSAILRKETKLELAKNRLGNKEKNEAVSFFRIVASVERELNRQLNLKEISLERWIAYLQDIKQKNEAEKAAIKRK